MQTKQKKLLETVIITATFTEKKIISKHEIRTHTKKCRENSLTATCKYSTEQFSM